MERTWKAIDESRQLKTEKEQASNTGKSIEETICLGISLKD